LGLITYFVFTIHSRISLLVKTIVGDEYSSNVKKRHKSMGKSNIIWSMISGTITKLSKKGVSEPFHMTDIKFAVFIIGPIIETYYGGVLVVIIVISLIILLIKEVFWFNYYKRILKEADKKNN